MGDAGTCAGPGCRRPLNRAGTGRPGLYCGPNCRQAAHRARVRDQEEAAARAARLASVKATAKRLRPLLEEAGFRTVAEHAALVYATATDPARPCAELDQAASDLLAEASELAELARRYRDAADLARQLER